MDKLLEDVIKARNETKEYYIKDIDILVEREKDSNMLTFVTGYNQGFEGMWKFIANYDITTHEVVWSHGEIAKERTEKISKIIKFISELF